MDFSISIWVWDREHRDGDGPGTKKWLGKYTRPTPLVKLWLARNNIEWRMAHPPEPGGPAIEFKNKEDMVKFILRWE